ncbi:MAG: hypothetical protein HOP17_15445 [Acidobacteria bacterium]|nr:hypothetical protein [Acidobacteriota bacterium]
MKIKAFLWTFIGLSAVFPIFAQQARTVTNADLEKYRNKRVQAERDYEQNYARMGFPSPEELKKQIEKGRVEREALSARLTAERIQREEAEAARAAAAAIVQPSQNVYVVPGGGGGYYYSNPYFYRRRQYRPVYPFGPVYQVGNGFPISNYNVFPPPVRQKPFDMTIK